MRELVEPLPVYVRTTSRRDICNTDVSVPTQSSSKFGFVSLCGYTVILPPTEFPLGLFPQYHALQVCQGEQVP